MIHSASVCVFLGLLQMRLGWAKFRRPEVFQSILRRYPLASWLGVAGMAKLITAAEMMLACALLAPVRLARLCGCWGLLVFLVAASVAIYSRYRKGEERFACGCSGNLEDETQVWGMLVRNTALLCVTTIALLISSGQIAPMNYAIGLSFLLAYDLFETALIQEGRARSWTEYGSDRT
jgi:hypothetical protein